jgi:hypothetical protein
MKVGWDATHGEFLINDHYYFSKLKSIAESEGIQIETVGSFSRLEKYDIIVFNYPEIRFKIREASRIRGWLRKGKTVVFASYYNNLDNVTFIINNVLKRLDSELRINNDVIIDEEFNKSDSMYPLALWRNEKVLMPCCSSVSGGEAVIVGSDSSKSTKGFDAIFASHEDVNGGEVVVIGTCVFWDNYSIDEFNNRDLALALLSGKV